MMALVARPLSFGPPSSPLYRSKSDEIIPQPPPATPVMPLKKSSIYIIRDCLNVKKFFTKQMNVRHIHQAIGKRDSSEHQRFRE